MLTGQYKSAESKAKSKESRSSQEGPKTGEIQVVGSSKGSIHKPTSIQHNMAVLIVYSEGHTHTVVPREQSLSDQENGTAKGSIKTSSPSQVLQRAAQLLAVMMLFLM